MRIKEVPYSWLVQEGRRLDCGPFLYGSVEAKVTLNTLRAKKDPLHSLTSGHSGGIYNGPQFTRVYLDDPAHGTPLLGSGQMMESDLSRVPLIRRRDAESSKLSFLKLQEGMTLIACSGSRSIGSMAYVRAEMAGMWSTQDCIKIQPDPKKIPPGYLYAFLSSKYGFPLVTAGTYGGAVLHIEPEHVRELPIPRLGQGTEQRVHELMAQGSRWHSEAASHEQNAQRLFKEKLRLPPLRAWHLYKRPFSTELSSLAIAGRLDAYFYSTPNLDAVEALAAAHNCEQVSLSDAAKVFVPGFFKRLYASDPQFGYPYLKGGPVFDLLPSSDQYLMKRVADDEQLVVKEGMILIQDSGQLGGLIGRCVLAGSALAGFAVTNNMVRVTAINKQDTGYLFAMLSNEYGFRVIARSASGSSIPHLEETRMKELVIPWPSDTERRAIGDPVMEARHLRDKAIENELKARKLVEKAIESGGA